MRLHLRDASNYYYLLETPVERRPHQAIGPAVDLGWWLAGCPEDDAAWPVERIFPDTSARERELAQRPEWLEGDPTSWAVGREKLDMRRATGAGRGGPSRAEGGGPGWAEAVTWKGRRRN